MPSPARARIVVPALVAALVLSCGGGPTTEPGGDGSATLRVINATGSVFSVAIDGQIAVGSVGTGTVSPTITLAPGARSVRLVSSVAVAAVHEVSVRAGDEVLVVGRPAGTAFAAEVVADTNAAPVAGKSKVRVIHLAGNAPAVDIWRTQPDWQTPVRVMFPFEYRDESPYLMSDPGNWRVWVTPAGGAASGPIADTGPFNVPGAAAVTVVLLDSAGVLKLRLLR